jgi:glycosyltransferase involved in cell wall biosynthesis
LTVINRPTSFGNHSYPVKLYEAMGCGVPAVATRTPATEWILQDNQQLLCRPEDHIDLGGKIQNALDEKQLDYGPQPRWKEIAQQMNELLMQDEFKLPFFNSLYQSRVNKS